MANVSRAVDSARKAFSMRGGTRHKQCKASNLSRKLIQKWRQHVVGDVTFELFHGAEMFAAGRAAHQNHFLILA
jgi:hypothetical protein